MHLLLEMHGGVFKGTCLFFMSYVCSCGKSTCSYDKTSTETPNSYLRSAEKYKACGQCFVAFSLWVYFAHKQQLCNDSNICALAAVYHQGRSSGGQTCGDQRMEGRSGGPPPPPGKFVCHFFTPNSSS